MYLNKNCLHEKKYYYDKPITLEVDESGQPASLWICRECGRFGTDFTGKTGSWKRFYSVVKRFKNEGED